MLYKLISNPSNLPTSKKARRFYQTAASESSIGNHTPMNPSVRKQTSLLIHGMTFYDNTVYLATQTGVYPLPLSELTDTQPSFRALPGSASRAFSTLSITESGIAAGLKNGEVLFWKTPESDPLLMQQPTSNPGRFGVNHIRQTQTMVLASSDKAICGWDKTTGDRKITILEPTIIQSFFIHDQHIAYSTKGMVIEHVKGGENRVLLDIDGVLSHVHYHAGTKSMFTASIPATEIQRHSLASTETTFIQTLPGWENCCISKMVTDSSGNHLFVGNDRGKLRYYNLQTSEAIDLEPHAKTITGMLFDNATNHLITCSYDKEVRVYDFSALKSST